MSITLPDPLTGGFGDLVGAGVAFDDDPPQLA